MTRPSVNKYRAAIEILQRGRDSLVESLADDVVSLEDELLAGGFYFNEFLEAQGTRLHFLNLLVSQLEQSADSLDESNVEPPRLPQPAAKVVRKRKPRTKKLAQQTSSEGKPDDV